MIMFGKDFLESIKGKQKQKFQSALEEQEVWIKADRGSLTALIYKISLQYLNTGISSEKELKNNELMLIFSDPVMKFFQMMDDLGSDFEPIIDIGLDLEEKDLLPKGITNKSHARRLSSEIKKYKYKNLSEPENQNELEKYKKKLAELIADGFSPLTAKEATPLIEEVIARVLMKK